ncbi:MAG: glycosyltransferase family 4 protein [Cyclobacteriaceae bacterium]
MVIYIYPVKTAFTERDIQMLQPSMKVKPLVFTQNPFALPFFMVFQFFQLIWYLPKTTHYLCFFGGYHCLWPVIFAKFFNLKAYIQCGGMDAMHLPGINYGNYRKKWLRRATVFGFKNCDLILPVADALVKSEYTYDLQHPKKQGLLHLIPDLKTPIKVIHNGFDPQYWYDDGNKKTENSFITVATGISKKNRMLVKGIDLILEAAKSFPNFEFTLIGDEQFSSDLPNVTIIGKLNPSELRSAFQDAQFYLQLSSSEGFPNALAEAMLCGCIPIGSAVGAIPEIIGDTGLVLLSRSSHQLNTCFTALKKLNLAKLRKAASNRVKNNFSYDKRKQALVGLFPREKP